MSDTKHRLVVDESSTTLRGPSGYEFVLGDDPEGIAKEIARVEELRIKSVANYEDNSAARAYEHELVIISNILLWHLDKLNNSTLVRVGSGSR